MRDVHAFIVGIDRYVQGNGTWDLNGPVANASELAGRLLHAGVPAGNIHLFLSWKQQKPPVVDGLEADGLNVRREADWSTIDNFCRDELGRGIDPGSRLLVFWSGHGFTDRRGRRIFLCSDYTQDRRNRVFNADNFALRLKGELGARFSSQRLFADVCGTYAGKTPLTVTEDEVEPRGPVDQLIYYASPDGEYAVERNGLGAFTSVLLEALAPFDTWPSEEETIERLSEAFKTANIPALSVSHFGTRERSENYHVGSAHPGPARHGIAAAAVECLNGLPVASTTIRRNFIKAVTRLGRRDLAASQGNYGMVQALSELSDGQKDQAPFGLAEFMIRVAGEHCSDPLSAWLAQYVPRQTRTDVENLLQRERPTKRLLIELTYDPQRLVSSFSARLRNQDLSVPPEPWSRTVEVSGWDEFAKSVGAVIEEVSDLQRSQLEIDFIADVSLFDMPFHRIELPRTGDILGSRFKCLLHYLRRGDFEEDWKQYCGELQNVPLARVSKLCIAIDQSLPVGSGFCYAGFPLVRERGCQEEKKKLRTAVQSGIPYIMWSVGDLDDARNSVETELGNLVGEAHSLDVIPDRLRSRRARTETALNMTLLWDDPEFLPFDQAQGPTT